VSTSAATGVAGPRISHLRPLDGLRGVAVLAVVMFHFAPDVAPGGFLGVDVFFVLSGFLITSLLVTEFGGTGHVRLRAFWVRRARRLFPALILVLLAVGAYAFLHANALEARSLRNDGLSALFYVANWRFISSGQSYIEQFIGIGPSPLRHTWSLAIEEQYYLVWPLVVAGLGVWVARRSQRGSAMSLRKVIVVACVVLAVASSVLMAILHEPGADPSRVYYGTDTRAHLLLLGSALGALTAGAVVVARVRMQQLLIVAGCAGALGLVALVAFVDAQDTWLYEGGYFVFALLIALLIVAGGQPGRNPLAWVLGTRPLVGLGLISYGVYLWHWPITVWFTEARTGLDGVALFALRAALTLGVSLASYVLVEQPIRHGALRHLGPAVPWVVTPIAILLAVAVLVVPVWIKHDTPAVAVPPPTGETASVTAAYATAPRCDGAPTKRAAPKGPKLEIAFYGNSVADEVVPCLTEIVHDNGSTLRATTQPGASMCDLKPIIENDLRVEKAHPDVVVFYGLPVAVSPCALEVPEAQRNREWDRDVREVVDRWTRAGIPVYLVPPVPKVGESAEDRVASVYRSIAADHPGRVQVIDAGTFLRDSTGTYVFEMECLESGEQGCQPSGKVVVRLALDAVHMCSDVTYRGRICKPEFAAGERRAATSLAKDLFAGLAASRG
jgi:peptidoglycan/LPS O-acetylase OafA/YrhL